MSVNRPKQFEVNKRTTRPMDGVTVGGKEYKFGKRTDAFLLNDPGVAAELMKNHRADVNVAEVEPVKRYTQVSRNFFGSLPEMPWRAKKVRRGSSKKKGE